MVYMMNEFRKSGMILEVYNKGQLGVWLVINQFDGAVVAQERTMLAALKTAKAMEASERKRVEAEYPDVA